MKRQAEKQSKPAAKRAAAGQCATAKPVKEKKPRPVRNIQKHADTEVRRAFPEICGGLIKKAKTGAIGQTKYLMKISGLEENPQGGHKRRGPTLTAILMAELEKAKQEPEEGEHPASEPKEQRISEIAG